mgnify:CR=1 FL=1
MRGRHTYGILKILKMEELICDTKKDYVALAVKLSRDFSFRDNIIKKIKENKKLIFNDSRTIKFLEDFFESLFKVNQDKYSSNGKLWFSKFITDLWKSVFLIAFH